MSYQEPDQLTLVNAEVFDKVLENEKPDGLVLLVFVSNWAGPCFLFDLELDKIEKSMGNEVLFLYNDIDEETTLGKRYNCRSVPSFILFRGGKEIAAGTGAVNATELKRWINDRRRMAEVLEKRK